MSLFHTACAVFRATHNSVWCDTMKRVGLKPGWKSTSLNTWAVSQKLCGTFRQGCSSDSLTTASGPLWKASPQHNTYRRFTACVYPPALKLQMSFKDIMYTVSWTTAYIIKQIVHVHSNCHLQRIISAFYCFLPSHFLLLFILIV